MYLDNSATTKISDEVLEEMLPYLKDEFGNVLDKEIGECYGEIATEQSGTNGFGYDPVFVVDGYGVTMAEMSEDLKNSISHRANALSKIISYVQSELI